MPIYFDNFNQQKVDLLKNHLTLMAEKNQAKPYEIFVDALKAVQKTDEPSEFDGYENYMRADTEQIKIIIYNTALSPRNDQYVFLMHAKNREEATNLGLNGMQTQPYSRAKISDWREAEHKKALETQEIRELKHKIKELEKQLEESDAYADQLAAAVETAKANGNKIGGVHWGDVVSVAVEGLVRRNTHLLSQIPGASGLAGIIEKDNERGNTSQPLEESEVIFKRKETTEAPVSVNQKVFVELFEELQKHFEENEIGQVIDIVEALSKDKSQLQPVLELLQETQTNN